MCSAVRITLNSQFIHGNFNLIVSKIIIFIRHIAQLEHCSFYRSLRNYHAKWRCHNDIKSFTFVFFFTRQMKASHSTHTQYPIWLEMVNRKMNTKINFELYYGSRPALENRNCVAWNSIAQEMSRIFLHWDISLKQIYF